MEKRAHFGKALKQMIDTRQLSVSGLAKDMGLKSKTEFFRILHDECSYDKEAAFYQQLMDKNLLALNYDERKALDTALEINRVGADTYQSNLAMWEMLRPGCSAFERIYVEGLPNILSLEQLFHECARGQDVHIRLIGLADKRVMQGLKDMLVAAGAARRIRIDHYLYSRAETPDIIRHLSALAPIIFSQAYQAYTAKDDTDAGIRWLFQTEMLLCAYTDESGSRRYYHLMKTEHSLLQGIAYQSEKDYSFWEKLIAEKAALLLLLKSDLQALATANDYIRYTDNFRQMEHNRKIYSVKPDIMLAFVPPEVLRRVVVESFRHMHFAPPEQVMGLVDALAKVHRQRVDNFFNKKKVTHIIFSQSNMLTFARTGRQTDHFFALRPYTPAERVAILAFCRSESMKNPYFNIHFAKREMQLRDVEITCYEGAGTMLIDAHTSYNLADDHAEAYITDPAFSEHFCNFFRTELLATQVLPAKESYAYFEYLIRVAGESE